MDWQKQFEEKFSHCFNIGVVPDDITKDKIIHFISSLLQQKDQEFKKILNSGKKMYELGRKEADQEWREKIEKLAEHEPIRTNSYIIYPHDLINFIKQ